MTQKDQEAFALISDKEAWKLTVKNAGLVTIMSPQYYGHVKLASTIPYAIGLDIEADTAAAGLVGGIASANILRMGLAFYTKKAYASISLDGLLFNGPTYLKQFKNK